MKESDIRKRDVLDRYLALVRQDVDILFDQKGFVRTACPACGEAEATLRFRKNNFSYVMCSACATLYANPRPDFDMLEKFYASSPSSEFWVKEFFMPVAEVRRDKIFRPRAEYASSIVRGRKDLLIGDIGAGFGLFLEELRKILPDHRYVAIEPSPDMAEICRKKNLEVKESCVEMISEMKCSFDFLTAFELLEHLFDPRVFMVKTFELLKPGGFFLFTTLNANGFDILLLDEKSKSVTPPHHINFFTLESVQKLAELVGFEIVKAETPGQLDWDIVEGAIKDDGVVLGRFWDHIARNASVDCKKQLQAWIADNKLSSHMRILARKPVLEEVQGV
jgi:2-polyprenyl-3-methyl-5-hydroxy-6-metoxy-1,4-benzoquinol methylase/Zn ribbon nucleic-acid-binding protein